MPGPVCRAELRELRFLRRELALESLNGGRCQHVAANRPDADTPRLGDALRVLHVQQLLLERAQRLRIGVVAAGDVAQPAATTELRHSFLGGGDFRLQLAELGGILPGPLAGRLVDEPSFLEQIGLGNCIGNACGPARLRRPSLHV